MCRQCMLLARHDGHERFTHHQRAIMCSCTPSCTQAGPGGGSEGPSASGAAATKLQGGLQPLNADIAAAVVAALWPLQPTDPASGRSRLRDLVRRCGWAGQEQGWAQHAHGHGHCVWGSRPAHGRQWGHPSERKPETPPCSPTSNRTTLLPFPPHQVATVGCDPVTKFAEARVVAVPAPALSAAAAASRGSSRAAASAGCPECMTAVKCAPRHARQVTPHYCCMQLNACLG